jgi:peptide/nickel transport system substrate-binding protein
VIRLRLAARVQFVSLVAVIAAGCGGDDHPRRVEDRSPATLVWGNGIHPGHLSPVVVASGFGVELCNLLFLRLVDFGPPPDLEFEHVLAESSHVAEDGKTLTYFLRRDVIWEDGVPTTAHDVKFTFDTISNPDVPYPRRSQIRNIESCEVVNDWTVRFHFSKPSWEPLFDTRFHIVPKHALEAVPPEEMMTTDFDRHPIGNGRFRFVEWLGEDRIVFEASDSCALGRPFFDRIVFRMVPEDNTLRAELLTGGVDVYHRYPSAFYLDDRGRPDLEFVRFSDRTYVYLGWNHQSPMFQDRRVRRALTFATDRWTIIEAFRSGRGTVMAVPMYEGHPDLNPNVKPLPFDVAEAGRLLDEAGWTDRDEDGVRMKDGERFEFTFLLIANNQISEEIGTMTQAEFGKLGIVVHTEFMEFAVYLEQVDTKEFDAIILARGGDFIFDPEDVFHSRGIEGRYNDISFSDPEIDRLIDLAKSTRDRAERRKIWWKFQERFHEVHPITVLYASDAIYPVRKDKVENPVMDVRGALYRVHEWRPAGRGT